MMTNFSQLMDRAVLSDSSLSLHIPEDWLQGRTVYGGLQAALAVKAMRQLADPAAPLRSLQVTFVGPMLAGEVSATATLLRQGRSAGHVQVEISQAGSLCLFAIGIFASNRQSEAFRDPAMPAAAKCVENVEEVPFLEGVTPPFLQHFASRIAEGAPLYSGAKDTRSKIYARHRNDSACTDEHLTALADLAPPVAAMQLSQPAPGSSMNWQLDFVRTPRQLAETAWFRVDAEAVASDHGYSWQNSTIWTDKGELAMLSRQCMAIFG